MRQRTQQRWPDLGRYRRLRRPASGEHGAVKETDPNAAVVLGGAPYTLPSSAPDSPERQYFDVLLREGPDFFDLFDLHLYGQADLTCDIEVARGMMRAFGHEKELVVREYNAPWPNLYPDATAQWSRPWPQCSLPAPPRVVEMARTRLATPPSLSVPRNKNAMGEVVRADGQLAAATADVHASLPAGAGREAAPHQLPRAGHAQPAGAVGGRTPDRVLEFGARNSRYQNPLSIMDLLLGKLALLDYEGTELRRRYPSAETFLCRHLADVESVNQVKVPERPELFVFEVRRAGREPMFVVWVQRDSFTGEDEPPVTFDWIWPAAQASALDALGHRKRSSCMMAR